jgi:hypothetical protein
VRTHNVHERVLSASPEVVSALFSDPDGLWPGPRARDGGLRMGTTLLHTVEGEAGGDDGEELWRDRIGPLHDRPLEQLLDRGAAAVA